MDTPGPDDLEVRMVRLPPMRVASVRAFSTAPERDAWQKMRAWAEPKGLLTDDQKHPVFGFNNPNPSEGSDEYGYEFWVSVDSETTSEGDIGVKDFEGGLYAVTTCKLLGDSHGSVPQVWMKLWKWAQSNQQFRWREVHELEKPHDPLASVDDMVLDLYLPVQP